MGSFRSVSRMEWIYSVKVWSLLWLKFVLAQISGSVLGKLLLLLLSEPEEAFAKVLVLTEIIARAIRT